LIYNSIVVGALVAGSATPKVGTVRQQHKAHTSPTAQTQSTDLDDETLDELTGEPGGPESGESPLGTQPESKDAIVNEGSDSSASGPLFDEEKASHDFNVACTAETICRLKSRIRFGRGAKWSPKFCRALAEAVLSAADEFDLNPALVLAVAINESDLNADAVLEDRKDGKLYAKDGGLMGIRCVVNKRGRCTNGLVKGLPWKKVMHPLTNIRLGAQQLALYRDGGGAERKTVRRRGRNGEITTRERVVRCRHKNHAYWAHYNHGVFYKPKSFHRHYPHRVAVLYHALVEALNVPRPGELDKRAITVRDPGKRRRTTDRPVGQRYKLLTDQILESGACDPLAMSCPAQNTSGARERVN